MKSRIVCVLAACGGVLFTAQSALAGMPSPLPDDLPRALRLTESAEARLAAISFFVVGLLVCTTAVWGLWNFARCDLPKWPRLSFGKALAIVVLWGLAFVIVLTMISGARELMTPGAWKKNGITYKLASESEEQP